MAGASEPGSVPTKQQRIAELAKQSPQMGFTSLNHYLDVGWLLVAFLQTRGRVMACSKDLKELAGEALFGTVHLQQCQRTVHACRAARKGNACRTAPVLM